MGFNAELLPRPLTLPCHPRYSLPGQRDTAAGATTIAVYRAGTPALVENARAAVAGYPIRVVSGSCELLEPPTTTLSSSEHGSLQSANPQSICVGSSSGTGRVSRGCRVEAAAGDPGAVWD